MDGSSSVFGSILAFFHRFGEVVGGIVLGALYFLLLGPVAMVVRLATDPLRRRPPRDTAFVEWREDNETLGAAHRQG